MHRRIRARTGRQLPRVHQGHTWFESSNDHIQDDRGHEGFRMRKTWPAAWSVDACVASCAAAIGDHLATLNGTTPL
eukprot:5191338-Pyramimonas_sp.AAC.1